MGGAIFTGLVTAGASDDIRITNRSAAKAEQYPDYPNATSLSLENDPSANLVAVRGARIVLVGVKPAMVPDLLREIAADLEPDAVIVSVAAGVTIATMEALVPGAVLRSMPNTPSLVGRGVTGLAAGSRSSDEDFAIVRSLFEFVGEVVDVPEDRIDALSTISGSGPAYVFFLMEQLIATAEKLGFSSDEAATMVEGTFIGAAELLRQSDAGPSELRRRVTSPKGTTERAVAVLAEADLSAVFDRATAAALARNKELAAGS